MTRAYIAPDIIIKLLLAPSVKDEELIERFEDGELEPVLSRFALFEAIACIEKTDAVDVRLFKRLLRVVDLFDEGIPQMHYVVSNSRKESLRGLALGPSKV